LAFGLLIGIFFEIWLFFKAQGRALRLLFLSRRAFSSVNSGATPWRDKLRRKGFGLVNWAGFVF